MPGWVAAALWLLVAAGTAEGSSASPTAAAPQIAQAPAAAAPHSPATMTADELILQFKRPDLQAALRQATPGTPVHPAVLRALVALGQRHGVTLHYIQTLGVGSALVAVTPASAQLNALVARMAADAEVESVEVNARMTTLRPGLR